uniref:Hercynine oxygenase n=1 Tax=Candidatus Methanophaga sp. ANME-1 ERB7 TaxID=2759913 RepID=A0A7G9Z788_9EURY|nr:hercynine oxygenase [Methanosarcinales archaeon ANME-1 ERB7]
MQQTTDGGYILAGSTDSYSSYSWRFADILLVKTDSAGNEEWNRSFGRSEGAESVQQTTDGGYILAGSTRSHFDGVGDLWLVKTDSAGNEEWNWTFDGSDYDRVIGSRERAHSVQQTSDGGYITVGTTEYPGVDDGDVWLIKLEGTTEKAMKAEFLSPTTDFSVLKDSNVPLKVKVTYEGEPTTGAGLTASFSNVDPDVKLTEGENGVYTGTWTPTTIIEGQVESPVEITVEAYHGTLGQVYAKVNGVIKTEIPLHIEDFGITPHTRNFPANGPITAGINDKIGIWYSIKSTDTSNRDVKLITKIRSQDTGEIIPDPTNDKVVTLPPSGTRWYSRSFVIPSGTKADTYDVLYSIYKPDQSDKYDETWKAGWLIVDTDTYTVSLRSSANDGSLNIGSIRVATATHNLPSEVTKQYRMNEYYYVEAIAPTGYNFDQWETIGGVSINDIGNGFGILSVTGAGTLNAVLKKAPTFEIILEPSSILLNPGEKGSTLVNVKSLNGFSGSVELGLGWDEASGNWFSNVNFDPKIVTMTSGEQVISELSFDLSSSATPGVYNMHVGATDLQRQCQSKYENLQLSVKGTTTQDPVLANWEITPTMAKAGDTVELHYYIYNPNSQSLEVTLGVTMRAFNGQEMVDEINDIDVTVTPGRNWYKRSFAIKPTAATGYYDVMWGIHKAHLAGMYGNSGWLENRLKVVTFGELLDDLAKAEEELYQSSISLVNHYDRLMVCDFVHYSIVFDSDLATETAALVIQMGVPIPVVYAIVEGIMAVKMVYPEAEAISAQNTCIKDDQKYLQTRDLLRSGFPENNPEFNLKDKECIDNINIKHQDFQSFLADGYSVADRDRDKLALIIENEILLLNKANSELFLAKTQPIFYGDEPIGWTLVYHDKYEKTIRRVPLASRSGYKVSVVIATLGMFGACALTGPGVVACAPVLVAGSIGGYAGNRIIDAGLYDAGLSFISDEANGINIDLQNIDNYYTSLLTETENKLNLVESIPQGKIISLNGENSEVGKLTTLNVKFSNIGTKNLQAKGYFNLFYNGNYLATITTDSKNIKSGVTEDISTTIMPELAGTYVVNCYVQYDNMKSDTLSTQISVAPVTSAIVVNTNNANAKFTIIGLQSFSGDGTYWSTTEALIGTYKIIFDPIEGYDTLPSQELELTPDSTITFTGDYIQQTITYSITLSSNRADIPLIVDGKVIYHDELTKTFTWSKNSEHTIKAQTEVYKDASTKYVFVKWDDGNTDSERTITVNSDKTYNAEYKTRYCLSLKTNPENIGTVFGAGWYDVNSPAEITAPVITGYAFTGWTVDDSTVAGNTIMISMDSSHNVVANYVSTDTALPTVIGNTPTATIDSITPNTATQDEDTVCFKGHGTDTGGYIVDYYWESSKDGFLSSSNEFTKSTSKLAVGTHTIYFKVKDDDGQWSDWTTAMLTRTIEGTSEITAYSFQYPIDDYAVTGYKFGQEVGSGRFYLGEDMLKPPGTPVYACADGVVKLANNKHAGDGNYGGLIIAEHTLPAGEKVCSLYGHLDHSKTLVVETEIVKKGETIGEIGRKDPNINGNSTPHLHFGIGYGAFSGEYAPDPNTTSGWYWAGYGKIDPNLKTNWWLKPSKFIGDHLNAQSSIAWYEQEGMQIAKSQNKPTMILFSSDRCPACAKLTGEFADTRVINMSKKFVPLVGSRELDSQYGIRYVPTIVFTNSQGMEVHRIVGYRDADTLVNEMQYALMLSSKPLSEPFTSTNTIGMEFVLIPAGKFDMGSPSGEEGRCSHEGPIHHVNIKKAFYMGGYEVTQKQWHEIMGDNPSYFEGDNLPVEQVFWDDVQEFIKKLNEKEGTDKYRLPSEAEWEYACRAGTTTRYSFGDDESKLGDYAWYDDNSGGKTHPVGQKKANPWGLYDMHGNVGEWVQDCWHDSYSGAPTDGRAWVVACEYGARVYRGGSWGSDARGCRSARRVCCGPRICGSILSFRLLKEV